MLLRQIATKAGVLNVPEWYEAGEVWVKNNPNTPFGEPSRPPCCLVCGVLHSPSFVFSKGITFLC